MGNGHRDINETELKTQIAVLMLFIGIIAVVFVSIFSYQNGLAYNAGYNTGFHDYPKNKTYNNLSEIELPERMDTNAYYIVGYLDGWDQARAAEEEALKSMKANEAIHDLTRVIQ